MVRKGKTWDVFISHASEDKESFVEPLAESLSAFGVSVWFDKFSLSVGDSLSRSIDEGLAKSNYGLVVLSPAFVAKRWPEYELRGLIAREMAGGKTILPIWHHISKKRLLKFGPPLADKLALKSDGLTIEQIAIKIIREIRPDIFKRIVSRIALHLAQDKAELRLESPQKLKPAPVQHPELPDDLISRIRLIRASVFEVHPHSMATWLDGFKRDSHPSREIYLWEHIAATYLEYLSTLDESSLPLRKEIFSVIFQLSFAGKISDVKLTGDLINENALKKIGLIYSSAVPPYDVVETSPFADEENYSLETLEMFKKFDKEHFGGDIPDSLVRKFIAQKNGTKNGTRKQSKRRH